MFVGLNSRNFLQQQSFAYLYELYLCPLNPMTRVARGLFRGAGHTAYSPIELQKGRQQYQIHCWNCYDYGCFYCPLHKQSLGDRVEEEEEGIY